MSAATLTARSGCSVFVGVVPLHGCGVRLWLWHVSRRFCRSKHLQLVVQLYLACAAVCIVAASPLRAAMPGRDGLEQPPLFSSELKDYLWWQQQQKQQQVQQR